MAVLLSFPCRPRIAEGMPIPGLEHTATEALVEMLLARITALQAALANERVRREALEAALRYGLVWRWSGDPQTRCDRERAQAAQLLKGRTRLPEGAP